MRHLKYIMIMMFVFIFTSVGFYATTEKELAPLPRTAYGPPIPQDKGYLVEEIRDKLYVISDGSHQTMFLTTGKGVIVVDAPPTTGKNIIKAIKDVTDEPITHVIYSHSHADHIGAASIYPADATFIAQAETAARLADINDPQRIGPYGIFVGGGPVPLPTITFKNSYTLTLGNQTVELEYKGANHEPGNIYIYAPKQKVLMLVDVIFPGWVPFKYLAVAEDIPGYIKAHDEVLSFDFDVFIGGHLTRIGTRKDVEIQREYIYDIRANAMKALQTVDFFAIAKETGFENQWNLFDTYLNAVAQKCTDLTLLKWKNRLGGADIWTFSHSWKMVESLRIN